MSDSRRNIPRAVTASWRRGSILNPEAPRKEGCGHICCSWWTFSHGGSSSFDKERAKYCSEVAKTLPLYGAMLVRLWSILKSALHWHRVHCPIVTWYESPSKLHHVVPTILRSKHTLLVRLTIRRGRIYLSVCSFKYTYNYIALCP